MHTRQGQEGKNDDKKDSQDVYPFFRGGGGTWISIATCFMLFLYAPLELLFLNQDEFWFDARLLAPIMFVVFLGTCIASILAFILLRKINEILYGIGLALYCIVFVCSYLQGNFLTGSLPLLDGNTIDWSLYKAEYVQSYVLWIVVVAVVATIYYKTGRIFFEKVVRIVSICMTLMFVMTLLLLALSNHGFEKKLGLTVTYKNMFQMSEDQNLVILVLDAVDAGEVTALMEKNSDYQDIFTDFTYYRNTMGAYPATRNSIPLILSGEWYENGVEFSEYEAGAYAESPLLANLENGGWKLGIYESGLLPNDNGKQRFENMISSKRGVRSKLMMIKWQLRMIGFRYAPYCLKPYITVNSVEYLDRLKMVPETETVYVFRNKEFYEKILDEEISFTNQKCFRFIHIQGGHLPADLNGNLEEIADGTYEDGVKAAMAITKAYLDKLKEAGVYDNSAIIVMADHGGGGLDYHNCQNPILFVKGINERRDFSISDAPISYADLQEAYVRLINGAASDQIFGWKSGDQRERRYLYYEVGEEDYMIEYMQPGSADDTDSMYETGNVYAR